MSIRKKLILSYIAMIVVPVVLVAITAIAVFSAAGRGSDQAKPAAPNQKELVTGEWSEGFLFAVGREPGLLSDETFLHATDERLAEMGMGMAVARNGRLLHLSEGLVPSARAAGGDEALLGRLDAYETAHRSDWGGGGNPWHSGYLKLGDASYEVDRKTVAEDTVYMLKNTSERHNWFQTGFPLIPIALILGIVLTNGLLTYFVSRSIIRPLQALKRAAERIKDGDLGEAALVRRKDEIGEVGAAFEEMRLRLKESIALQLQYEDNRKELLSNISHDLKTPIAAIAGCAEGLRSGIADTPDKRMKYIDMIASKTNDMDRMIDELFLFSKLDLKREPFRFETIDLAGYLRQIADEMKHDPLFQGVRISLDVPDEGRPEPVTADREKLGRVIANIANNSLKFMDKDERELSISLRPGPAESEVSVRIRDNGRGIAPEALPLVFERFYRADPSRNAAAGGSGLGLSIVRQLVEAHGGTVWAESEPGVGTTIGFTLTRAVPKEEAEEPGDGTDQADEGGEGHERDGRNG
ncbi:HAMP domain-containing sensor histidine kinase [Cohnella sp. REN36]|uniref:sensor histidine kinase n=1 Tax=Cohnella sp. REN36 TaxID=2887347 RepID=UPI001D1583CD|nr:HAMP domain-containing histidine kinase [Cohnella sp. REN36]